jgi:uncharacterized membrane protein YesL
VQLQLQYKNSKYILFQNKKLNHLLIYQFHHYVTKKKKINIFIYFYYFYFLFTCIVSHHDFQFKIRTHVCVALIVHFPCNGSFLKKKVGFFFFFFFFFLLPHIHIVNLMFFKPCICCIFNRRRSKRCKMKTTSC